MFIDYGFYVEAACAFFYCGNPISDCSESAKHFGYSVPMNTYLWYSIAIMKTTVDCLRRGASKILMLSQMGIVRPELRSAVLLWDKSRLLNSSSSGSYLPIAVIILQFSLHRKVLKQLSISFSFPVVLAVLTLASIFRHSSHTSTDRGSASE